MALIKPKRLVFPDCLVNLNESVKVGEVVLAISLTAEEFNSPRIHQEHSDSASGPSGSGGVSFMSTMPLPPRVVATSKIGRKAGLGQMATTDFSSIGPGQALPRLEGVRVAI